MIVRYNSESNENDAANASVDQGIRLVKKGQNDFLLAYKSQFGWKTVREYLEHELPDDSDDEKKIYWTEARAAKNSRKLAFQRNDHRTSSIVSSKQSSYLTAQSCPIPTIVTRGPFLSQSSRVSAVQKVSPESCFDCGKIGHWGAIAQ